jgi:hypothetical protein
LSSLFKDGYSNGEVRRHERKDIPDILLSNRFLELFSKPTEDRAIFASKQEDNVVAYFGKNSYYSKFNLILPNGSKVLRDKSGSIVIRNGLMRLEFSVNFQSMGYVLPHKFIERYLGRKQVESLESMRRISVYEVPLRVSISIRMISLLRGRVWRQEQWIDSFMESIRLFWDGQLFLERIQWDTVQALLVCLSHDTEELMKRPKARTESIENFGEEDDGPKTRGQSSREPSSNEHVPSA